MVNAEKRLAAIGVSLALAALAVALGTERFGHIVPCALCLVERWPYRIAIGLGALAFVLPGPTSRWVLWLLSACLLAGAATAFVHVGVEHGWWPSPLPECAAPTFGGGSIAERLAHMPARPAKPCDDPTYLLPGVPLSMAGMNLLFALALAGFLAISLLRNRRLA
jgi:disulfide bond formation protein DsbB